MRILARRDPITPLWRGFTPEVVPGALADPAAVARLCAGAEVVVHAAGLVKAPTAEAFAAVNVDGARRVAEAAIAADVPRVVLVSSLAAREPQLSRYAASKRAAEALMAESLGERLTVARPPAIYGPGDRELLPVFRAADSAPALPVLAERARVGMIHVEDAARQIAALAAMSAGGIHALSDERPDGYAWRELMAAAAAACGRTPRLIRVPGGVVRALGITNDFIALLGVTPMLTSGKARELLHPDWAIAPHERTAALPPAAYGLAEGFRHTVAWYRRVGLLKQ